MPTPTTLHGINKPLGNENFTRAAFNAVLDALDTAIRPISLLTTAQRDALSAGQKWTDRIIRNTTTGNFERWTGSSWSTDLFSLYALDADLTSAIATHEADTTAVHGIADTSLLDTIALRTAAIAAHVALADPHAQYALESTIGAANGLASLDANTRLTYAQMIRHSVPATKVGAYAVVDADHFGVIRCNGTFTVSLPAVATRAGFRVHVKNIGTGTITLDPNAAEQIESVSSLGTLGATTTIAQGESVTLLCDGTQWWII